MFERYLILIREAFKNAFSESIHKGGTLVCGIILRLRIWGLRIREVPHPDPYHPFKQGCINRSILPSGMGARGVSSEHVENMEMFSCSPT